MQATIRYTEDGDKFEFTPPDSDPFELVEVPESGCVIFEDEDTGRRFEVCLNNYVGDDLEPDTVYELKECETLVSEGDIEEEEDEEEGLGVQVGEDGASAE
jgi:hypothetical protein